MVQKSRVSILEQEGNEFDIGRESGDSDFLVCGGLSFKNSDDFLIERVGNVIKCKYPTFSYEVNYNGDNIANVIYYTTTAQIEANRILRSVLGYSGDNVTSETVTIYDPADGVAVLRTITNTYTYTGDNITSVEVSEA